MRGRGLTYSAGSSGRYNPGVIPEGIRMKLCAVAVLGVACGLTLAAQSKPAAKADPWAKIPAETLSFGRPIPLKLPQSQLMGLPFRCDGSGKVYLRVLMKTSPRLISDYASVDKTGHVVLFPVNGGVLEISDMRQDSDYPGKKHFYAMVEGYSRRAIPAPGETKVPWQQFIADYNPDGTLDSITTLHTSIFNTHFAVLPSGKIVAMGMDPANRGLHLYMLDRDGRNPESLNLTGSGLYSSRNLRRLYPGERGTPPGYTDTVASAGRFVPWGDDVLFVQSGTDFPVLVIGDSGIVNEVRLQLPPGARVDSLIPSSGSFWYARVYGEAGDHTPQRIVEFDPDTGKPLRQLRLSVRDARMVACRTESGFVTVKATFPKDRSAAESKYPVWNLVTASE